MKKSISIILSVLVLLTCCMIAWIPSALAEEQEFVLQDFSGELESFHVKGEDYTYETSKFLNFKKSDSFIQDGGFAIGMAESVRTATIVIATVPILCIYPFLQKYFVAGVTLGSIKE